MTRSVFSDQPAFVLVRTSPQQTWSTRPTLIPTQEELRRVQELGNAIVQAGFPPPKVLVFKGTPTYDLLIESANPHAIIDPLRTALEGAEVQVEFVGRNGDLSYFRHLWRHM